MIELGPLSAPPEDLLRLIAIPAFLWAALTDINTRRIPNALWPPLFGLAVIALGIETVDAYTSGGHLWREFVLTTALSIVLLVTLAYGFWYIGGFGGADAKALMTIAVLFPTYPTYVVGDHVFPVVEPAAGIFSLSILTNAVLLGLVYPLGLAGWNLTRGEFRLASFVGRPVPTERVENLPGRLLETPDGFDRNGLDLDALRMYLAWRECTLDDLRNRPAEFRDRPPTAPGDPGDGAVTDGGRIDDPWAAEAFLDDIDHSAYGTSVEDLRAGLNLLTTRDTVWYSPGIPFLMLVAVGLLVALLYGDLFLVAVSQAGLV